MDNTPVSLPRVLMHACCGPCCIMPAIRLREEGFAVSMLFLNPNIHPLAEYLRRREAMLRCAERLGAPVLWRDDAWDVTLWLRQTAGVRDAGEERCRWCWASRLEMTADDAAQNGFPFFTTSLLYSRYQRHETVAALAEESARAHGVEFLYRDFRQDWREGVDMAKKWDLHRQSYCGCIYSEAERHAEKLKKIRSGA